MSTTGPGAQAKPTDAVGFTKIVTITAPALAVPAGSGLVSHADCPAGTTLSGGGYVYTDPFFSAAAAPAVVSSGPQSNGWWVSVSNDAVGATTRHLGVYALCAS
jgi:hypothetical protein